MCGIVGYISKDSNAYKDEKAHFMRFALALDTLRGTDSTGIMTLRGKFNVDCMHTTLAGDRFVHTATYKKKYQPGWAQVGHNRAATKGEVSLANAHPFSFGPVTLVHNGTLYGGGISIKQFDDKLEVDSMQIANALSKVAPSEARDVLNSIDGSFALAWFDERDRSVNLARNGDRPLHYGLNSRRDIMWFMSDGVHLHAVTKSLYGTSASTSTIFLLDRHKHLKFKKGDLVPEVTTLSPFVRSVLPSSGSPATGGNAKQGGQTALERATEKWKSQMEGSGAGMKITNGGSEYPVRVHLGGRDRAVPDHMVEVLKDEYDVTPGQLMEFRPKKSMQVGNKRMMVLGVTVHEEWGGSEWPSVTYVPLAQARAYKNSKWLVRPIGVTHPWDSKPDLETPAMLVHTVHCDWEGYLKRKEESEARERGAQDSGKVDFVIGPGGIAVPWKNIRKAFEAGCISCGMSFSKHSLGATMWVNNARDLLCPACIDDLKDSCGYH